MVGQTAPMHNLHRIQTTTIWMEVPVPMLVALTLQILWWVSVCRAVHLQIRPLVKSMSKLNMMSLTMMIILLIVALWRVWNRVIIKSNCRLMNKMEGIQLGEVSRRELLSLNKLDNVQTLEWNTKTKSLWDTSLLRRDREMREMGRIQDKMKDKKARIQE